MPAVIAVKGGLPFALALLGRGLFYAWEALGFLAVAALARWLYRRSGPWAAALGAALGILVWEVHGFHVYPWSWGAALGALPWLARSAAFLTTAGLLGPHLGLRSASTGRLARRRGAQAVRCWPLRPAGGLPGAWAGPGTCCPGAPSAPWTW